MPVAIGVFCCQGLLMKKVRDLVYVGIHKHTYMNMGTLAFISVYPYI